jgi:HAD superfamily hydrolase (TIGR01509 family)
VTKPDPAIYEAALARLGRAAGETVFIDDAPANIAAARMVGMHAIQFTPALDLEAALAALGVRA